MNQNQKSFQPKNHQNQNLEIESQQEEEYQFNNMENQDNQENHNGEEDQYQGEEEDQYQGEEEGQLNGEEYQGDEDDQLNNRLKEYPDLYLIPKEQKKKIISIFDEQLSVKPPNQIYAILLKHKWNVEEALDDLTKYYMHYINNGKMEVYHAKTKQ